MKLKIILFLFALFNNIHSMNTKMVTRNSEREVHFTSQLPEDEIFYCQYAQCPAWFYRQKGLATHCARKHPTGKSSTLPKKIKKKSSIRGNYPIQKAATKIEMPSPRQSSIEPSIPRTYKEFCEKQKKLYPIIWNLKTSPSALREPIYYKRPFYKQRILTQFPYECCLKLLEQHSYKKHLIEEHPELYNYHFKLVRSQQKDLHLPAL